MNTIHKYWKTAAITAQKELNAGVSSLLPNYFVRLIQLLPLLMLWQILLTQGVDAGMSLEQMLTYTLVSALLTELILLKSPLTDWLYDGMVTGLYGHPMGILGQVVAQTLGSALPMLLFFSLPMALAAPLLGISLRPVSPLFLPSLVLCVSLGFAVDLLFAALLIRMMNARYLVYCIRNAVTWLFSGSVIPFVALPWDLGELFRFLPMGSLGGATLSIYTGLSSPWETLLIQLFWNLALWPCALLAFQKSRERLVSHNG